MFYYLFTYLNEMNIPGAGVFQYISFRAGMAFIFSMLIATIYGKKIIRKLQKLQIGEEIRDLGLEGQFSKKGTPTMGGIIIILSILLPTLFLARLDNIYIILMLITTVWLGLIGFADDYIKVFRKNKLGLPGRFKIVGQVGIGLIVGITLYVNDDVVIRIPAGEQPSPYANVIENSDSGGRYQQLKSTKTTIPFLKNNEFDYAYLVSFMGSYARPAAWIVFVIAVILITTAVSNGANLTDGLDGLATGVSAINGTALAVFAYVSGNVVYASYLNIMYIPYTGELVIFMSAFIGATVGFLWYNSYPAQVFMGDTGSLTLGGIIAVMAILVRKELLIPIMCGIFLVENLSVVIQVFWFKYTRRRYGVGRRIFLMAPLHHHFQKQGYAESKIVTRFWIMAIILSALSIITLKLR